MWCSAAMSVVKWGKLLKVFLYLLLLPCCSKAQTSNAPQILIQPESAVSVDYGAALTLTCAALGSPVPDVTWYRNGNQVNNGSSNALIHESLLELSVSFTLSILELCPVALEDAGQYSCDANSTGGNHSALFQVIVNQENPTLTEFPLDTTVNITGTASFTCSATGIPLPDIFWFKDSSPLDNSVNITQSTNGTSSITSVLVFSDLVLTDAGVYSCNASHPTSGSDTSDFIFAVQSVVAIRQYPDDTIAMVGDNLAPSCTAAGIPAPQIAWFKDGQTQLFNTTEGQFPNSSNYFTVSVLNLCDLQLSDSGEYSCTASNTITEGTATDTRSFMLEVQAPPTVEPGSSEPIIGVKTRDGSPSQISVTFSITRDVPAVEVDDIFWTYHANKDPGVMIDVAAQVVNNSNKYSLSDDLTTLIIFNLNFSDGGFFTLSATNEVGTSNATQELVIHVEPVLLNETYSGNETIESHSAMFTCVADGIPLPNIIWLHNGSFIFPTLRHVISDPITVASTYRDHVPTAVRSTLTVSELRLRDSGNYICRVDPFNIDRGRSDFSNILDIHVQPAPIDHCQNMPCLNGGTCSTQTESYLCTCDPIRWTGEICEIEWMNFTIVDIVHPPELPTFPILNSRVNLTCGAVGQPEPNITWYKDGVELPGERSKILVIQEVQLGDRGRYHCNATNFNPESMTFFHDGSEDVVVNIKGIAQYRTVVTGTGQVVMNESAAIIDRLSQRLSGVMVADNATIFSIEQAAESDRDTSVLITLLAPAGGSDELTEQLSSRLNITVEELGISVGSVLRFDGCTAEQTTVGISPPGVQDIILNWPESDLGERQSLQCPCGSLFDLQGAAINRNASRVCEGTFTNGAKWGPSMHTQCDLSDTTRRLCEVASLIDEPKAAIVELKLITRTEEIDVVGIDVTTTLLTTLSDDVLQNETLSLGLLEVVDNLLAVEPMDLQESQEDTNTSARILEVVEAVAVDFPIPENETSNVIKLEEFSITVNEIDPETFRMTGFEFPPMTAKDVTDATSPDAPMSPPMPISISIPQTFLDDVQLPQMSRNESISPRITNTVYQSEALFTRRNNNTFVVGSIIASATFSVGSRVVRVSDLSPPILLTFAKRPDVINGSNVSCNFWDFSADGGFGDWSSENCTVREDNETLVVCECTHFTNFAMLLDPNPAEEPNIPDAVAKGLTAVSYIGVITSIICLTVTVVTYLWSKKLRTSQAGQLLLNLSFALLGIYVMFIISLHATKPEPLCAVAGGFLHYFMLVTFLLMAAEAVNLYLKLVIVLGIPEFLKNRYVLKVALIAWIAPIIIVIASETPDWRNYVRGTFCRPYGAPFYGGLVAPFAFIYIMNWIIFILIFSSILRKKSKKETTEQKGKAAKAKLKQNFIIALTLSLLFGLGWGVGFAATTSISIAPVSVTLQAIFILLTSFQGLFIFIMHCMRSEEARKTWKDWLYVITCHKITLDHKITKLTSNSATASGEAQYRRKVPPNPYGTLTTSTDPDSNTLKRILKKELESSETLANESTFVCTTLETTQECEKRDLSLSKEENMNLLPHCKSPEIAPGPAIFEKTHAASPLVTSPEHDTEMTFTLLIDHTPGDDMEMTIVSPVSDAFEVVHPKAIHVPKAKKEEKAGFDIMDAIVAETPADPVTSADLQTSTTSVLVNMDVILPAD